MDIKEIKSERVAEKYYKINHPSGLTIYVYPKEGYNSAYAIFGTRYGSINTKFSVDDGDVITVPDGIAHYLEHKLFESEDGDAFVRYAKTGANANAYTSFEKTCYLFSCTEKFDESLEILLDFVQSPYFTAQTVAKEQGIIGQEIKMYDDAPDWRVMFNMLENMYHNHPVKIDIAGTVESIAEITAEKLYEVYNVFYNLNNMVLCVSGNVTVDKVLKTADRLLKPSEKHTIHNVFENEPYEIVKPYVEQEFSVSMPIFNLGFKEKDDCVKGDAQAAHTDILLFLLASETSELYRKLLDANLKENGIDKEELKKKKKSIYGDTVASLNSVDTISNILADYHFKGNNMFDYIDEIANATIEDVTKRLDCMLDVNNCTLSVVKPIQDGEK